METNYEKEAVTQEETLKVSGVDTHREDHGHGSHHRSHHHHHRSEHGEEHHRSEHGEEHHHSEHGEEHHHSEHGEEHHRSGHGKKHRSSGHRRKHRHAHRGSIWNRTPKASRRSGKQKEWIKTVKKHKDVLMNAVIGILILLLISVFIMWQKEIKHNAYSQLPAYVPQTDTVVEEPLDDGVLRIELPLFEEEVPLVTSAVDAYMTADLSEDLKPLMTAYREKYERLDEGLPVKIHYELDGLGRDVRVASAVLEISENSDFSDKRVFALEGEETSVLVWHLKTGTQYYYRFRISLSDHTTTVVQRSFRTEATPRILSIDGAVNVRDIGGWETADGKVIRQGLLYRGSELDGAVEPAYQLTDRGREDMLTVLGIRTELDLRASSVTAAGDVLGANVEHVYFGLPAYTQIFSEWGDECLRTLFSYLADERNYPIYLHCTYGLDRTGTACYLLEAMLGMKEEDLLREYDLSALSHGQASKDLMAEFISALKTLDGYTMQDKVEGYLLDAGVTQEQIERVRSIFLK